MSLISKDQGGDFKMVPEGMHVARSYLMADVGYQETRNGTKLQVILGWEVPGELMDDGRPMIIYSTYTNSMNEKAHLRRAIDSWRGKKLTPEEASAFDLRKVLGVPCQLDIQHNTVGNKTYANVVAVVGMPKGMVAPDAINDVVCFDIDSGEIIGVLPEWIQDKVDAASKGDTESMFDGQAPNTDERNPPPVGDFDDDIPFSWSIILPLIPVIGVVGYATETLL